MPFIILDKQANGLPPEVIGQWEKLAISTGQGDPVCCAPNWNLAFHQVMHPDRRVFYKSEQNSLLMFNEYTTQAGEIYLVPLEDSWMFGQPLLGFYAGEILEEEIENFSSEYKKNYPLFVFSGIRINSPETIKLNALFSKTHSFFRYGKTIQSFASLKDGLDGWLGRRSGNHRAKLKKAARKAHEEGIYFERHCPGSPEEADLLFARMLTVEAQSWKGLGQCGMTEYPSREFYGVLLQKLAVLSRGYIIFARRDDKDIGFIFGGSSGQVYRGQQFSYINEFRNFSIGNLLQLEKIKWLCELGFIRYDMGPITGPRMSYKEHWTESYREIQTWVMRKNF